MAVSDYSTTPASNTNISEIDVSEGCSPGGVNNAIRQIMADAKTEQVAKDASIALLAPIDAPTFTGSVTLSGTLGVTGVTTLSDELLVTGDITASSQVITGAGAAAAPGVQIGSDPFGFNVTSGGILRVILDGVFEGQFDAGNISGNDKTVITREKLPRMFLYTAATTLFEGDTTSGSNLVLANTVTESEGPPVVPSGTWMSLGYCPQNRITTFVRVS